MLDWETSLEGGSLLEQMAVDDKKMSFPIINGFLTKSRIPLAAK